MLLHNHQVRYRFKQYIFIREKSSTKVAMAHVVTDNCIKCKFTDCVEVCPVDCFYEGKNMLVINPEECIDCGVCVPECPAGAIKGGSEELIQWMELNKEYSQIWPHISQAKAPLKEAEAYNGKSDKFAKYFSENLS